MEAIAAALAGNPAAPLAAKRAQLRHIAMVANATQAPALLALAVGWASPAVEGVPASLAEDMAEILAVRHVDAAFALATFAAGDAESPLGALLLPPAPRLLLLLPATASGGERTAHNTAAPAR